MTRMTPSEAFVETMAAEGVTVDHPDQVGDAPKMPVRLLDKYRDYTVT